MASSRLRSGSRDDLMDFTPLTLRVGNNAPKDFPVQYDMLAPQSNRSVVTSGANPRSMARLFSRYPNTISEHVSIYLTLEYKGGNAIGQVTGKDFRDFLEQADSRWTDLLHTYIVAETMEDVAAKNFAVRGAFCMVDITDKPGNWRKPHPFMIKGLYNSTKRDNGMRRFLVQLASTLSKEDIAATFDQLPRAFIRDLLLFNQSEVRGNPADVKKGGLAQFLETE